MTTSRRRLLTIGHSYCVALNRRLATELSIAGSADWDVTVAAPVFFHGDLQPITTTRADWESIDLALVPVYLSQQPHLFFYGRRLRELLNQPWDIVHCWEEPYVVAGWQVARWKNIQSRLIYWTGQTRVKKYPPPFDHIEHYCFSRCAGWLSRGRLGIDAMTQKGHANKPHEAIGLGLDTDVFKPAADAARSVRSELCWPDDEIPVIGYTGRFVEQKGLRILTAALDRISSPWRALFLGGGPMVEELKHWASRYGDRVRIVTAVSHDRVPAYLNACDFLCAPSLTTPGWREIFGRMVIEAFACGVPVVASDSGELPNVVSDAGVVTHEGDVPAWAAAIETLLNSPERRAELSARGLSRVQQEFTWRAVAEKHLRFFEQILRSR